MDEFRRRALSLEEIRAILGAVRDPALRLLFETYFRTGARRNELLGACRSDLRRVGDHFRLSIMGKGSKPREVKVAAELARRILALPPGLKGRLFSFHPRSVDRRFRAAAAEAGIPGAVVHMLRHSFASHALLEGADLQAIRAAMGHSSIAITSIYLTALKRWDDAPEDRIHL